MNPQLHDALSAAVATKRAQQLSPYARRSLLQDLDGPTLSNAPVSSVLPAPGPGLSASGVPDVTFKTYQTAWQPTDQTLDDVGAGNFVSPIYHDVRCPAGEALPECRVVQMGSAAHSDCYVPIEPGGFHVWQVPGIVSD